MWVFVSLSLIAFLSDLRSGPAGTEDRLLNLGRAGISFDVEAESCPPLTFYTSGIRSNRQGEPMRGKSSHSTGGTYPELELEDL
jgi:hypothetical protein